MAAATESGTAARAKKSKPFLYAYRPGAPRATTTTKTQRAIPAPTDRWCGSTAAASRAPVGVRGMGVVGAPARRAPASGGVARGGAGEGPTAADPPPASRAVTGAAALWEPASGPLALILPTISDRGP